MKRYRANASFFFDAIDDDDARAYAESFIPEPLYSIPGARHTVVFVDDDPKPEWVDEADDDE